MKVTIVSHENARPGAAAELHRFYFETADAGLPKSHSISLRTARVILEGKPPDDALTKMLRAIVSAGESDYDNLIGNTYTDDNDAPVQQAGRRRRHHEGRAP
ncbi:hypothetical protein QCE47_27255 [Caballeronia sp. LZ025]|uniref:hypothetical protein n=1 Tax=Caballeronia TaxID=1827195 RepID=UPI001FD0B623|nr:MULTISPECIES: hypothetical protein [Caballeronia]MDR5736016.1 hypothetical protein [Caballeronia sp. LZ025]